MDFTQAVRSCFSKYATFQGRAQRSEFWFFALFTTVGSIVISLLESLTFGFSAARPGVLEAIFSLTVLLPSIAVSVRRLHDLDKSGWWWWLWLIPIVGWIILLVWMVTKGTEGDNTHGPDPLEGWFDDQEEISATHSSSIPKVNRDD